MRPASPPAHGVPALVRTYPVIIARHQVGTGERRSPMDGRLSEVLDRGQTSGVLRDDLPPDVVNATLFAVTTAHTPGDEIPYPWYIISSLSSTVATLLVIAAAVYGHFQLGELRRARNVQALMEFHDYYHSLPVRDVRHRLLSGELGGPAELIDSRRALTPDDDHRLWQMVDKLEFLAALVNRQLVDLDVAYSIFSWSPPLVWERIEPVVVEHRAQGNPDYCANLERLVASYAAKDRRRR